LTRHHRHTTVLLLHAQVKRVSDTPINHESLVDGMTLQCTYYTLNAPGSGWVSATRTLTDAHGAARSFVHHVHQWLHRRHRTLILDADCVSIPRAQALSNHRHRQSLPPWLGGYDD